MHWISGRTEHSILDFITLFFLFFVETSITFLSQNVSFGNFSSLMG